MACRPPPRRRRRARLGPRTRTTACCATLGGACCAATPARRRTTCAASGRRRRACPRGTGCAPSAAWAAGVRPCAVRGCCIGQRACDDQQQCRALQPVLQWQDKTVRRLLGCTGSLASIVSALRLSLIRAPCAGESAGLRAPPMSNASWAVHGALVGSDGPGLDPDSPDFSERFGRWTGPAAKVGDQCDGGHPMLCAAGAEQGSLWHQTGPAAGAQSLSRPDGAQSLQATGCRLATPCTHSPPHNPWGPHLPQKRTHQRLVRPQAAAEQAAALQRRRRGEQPPRSSIACLDAPPQPQGACRAALRCARLGCQLLLLGSSADGPARCPLAVPVAEAACPSPSASCAGPANAQAEAYVNRYKPAWAIVTAAQQQVRAPACSLQCLVVADCDMPDCPMCALQPVRVMQPTRPAAASNHCLFQRRCAASSHQSPGLSAATMVNMVHARNCTAAQGTHGAVCAGVRGGSQAQGAPSRGAEDVCAPGGDGLPAAHVALPVALGEGVATPRETCVHRQLVLSCRPADPPHAAAPKPRLCAISARQGCFACEATPAC